MIYHSIDWIESIDYGLNKQANKQKSCQWNSKDFHFAFCSFCTFAKQKFISFRFFSIVYYHSHTDRLAEIITRQAGNQIWPRLVKKKCIIFIFVFFDFFFEEKKTETKLIERFSIDLCSEIDHLFAWEMFFFLTKFGKKKCFHKQFFLPPCFFWTKKIQSRLKWI